MDQPLILEEYHFGLAIRIVVLIPGLLLLVVLQYAAAPHRVINLAWRRRDSVHPYLEHRCIPLVIEGPLIRMQVETAPSRRGRHPHVFALNGHAVDDVITQTRIQLCVGIDRPPETRLNPPIVAAHTSPVRLSSDKESTARCASPSFVVYVFH